MQRFLLAFVLPILFISTAAQAQPDSLLSQLSEKWINAKAYTLKMAELMPEKSYGFKPTPEEMSFGEQLLHIADNITWLSGELKGDKGSGSKPAAASKKEIMAEVGAAYDKGLSAHRALSPAQLDEVVPFFAGPKAKRQLLLLMHDHQTHHVGQLIVYLRLQGMKPPAYVGW